MKKKTLLTSILTVVMCLSLAIGGTFALFTSESNVDIAVTSGKVSLTATIDQNSVATKELYDTEYTNGTNNTYYEGAVTFTTEGLTLTNFIPGDGIKFNIIVKNTSNVTVKYRTTISCYEDNGLFAGLDVTIGDRENYNGNEYVTNWATLLVGSSDIIVPVEIVLPEGAGNNYQEKTCKISYAVEAVQGNAKTTNVSNTVELDGNATSSATFGTNGVDSPTIEMPANVLNAIAQNTTGGIAIKHDELTYDTQSKIISYGVMEVVDNQDNEIDLEAMGNTTPIPVTLAKQTVFAPGTEVYVYHDGKHIATTNVAADGTIPYTTTHFCEIAVSTKVLYNNVRVNSYEKFAKVIAEAQTLKKDITVVLDADITLTKQLLINKGINVTIDLNGYDIDANVSTSEVILLQKVAGNSLTIKSSKDYAQFNVGGKALVLAYADVTVENVEIRVDEIKSSSYQTIKMQGGALAIKNVEFNVHFLGTSLISGASSVVVEDTALWLNTVKMNAGAIITGNRATEVVLKNIKGNITLDPTYNQYLVKSDNVTMDNFNAKVVDLNGACYEIVKIEDIAAGNKIGYNKIIVEDIYNALANGETVNLNADLTMNADASNAYGATGLNIFGGTLDMNGKTLKVTGANNTWDTAISITAGTIKNVKVAQGFRGIFINHNSTVSGKVYLENVIIDGTTYTLSCDQGTYGGLEATNCTFNGWTSFAETTGDVKFTNCSFGGRYYKVCVPYAPTVFEGCDFAEGYEFYVENNVTFKNCTINGKPLTAENYTSIVLEGADKVTVA